MLQEVMKFAMARKVAVPTAGPGTTLSVQRLAKEADKLALQSEKAKRQMDQVQKAADTVVHKAAAAHAAGNGKAPKKRG
jgi:hypothetical protein